MTVSTILLIIWIHFVSDFMFQNDKMAINKSSSNKWLLIHTTIYSLPFFLFGFWFAIVNFIFHFLVDYDTSRWTTRLYLANKRHWFFVVIGLDQALHMSCLILTINYFKIVIFS